LDWNTYSYFWIRPCGLGARYVSYLFIGGAFGLIANVIVVYALLRLSGMSLDAAQVIAGMLVIGLNFLMNNRLTFRSARLRGWRLVQGLSVFYLACSIGLSFNLTSAIGFRDIVSLVQCFPHRSRDWIDVELLDGVAPDL
jgi:putative flippase GtrA